MTDVSNPDAALHSADRAPATDAAGTTYRICTRCVMDTSDPDIRFDGAGVCNHCHHYETLRRTVLWDEATRAIKLERLVARIKAAGRGREYDCIIGVSGGVDSTYVAYLVRRLGLRPLAVHMDNGWNSTQAVTNIERALKTLGIDLHTEVLDWDEFRDLQRAFLVASTPDSEIPTDHAIEAVLMKLALKHRVKFVLVGSNVATEAIMPTAWSHGIRDWKYIAAVHRRFGRVPLDSFPHFTLWDFVSYRIVWGRRHVPILNYVHYVKSDVMRILIDELGWEDYGGKHHESLYTRFFQSYILPQKFGADKRRAHLSTLVCSGQLTREEALERLTEPICAPEIIRSDRDFVLKKLELSAEEFDAIMQEPPRRFWDYPSYERGWVFRTLQRVYRLPKTLRGVRASLQRRGGEVSPGDDG